MPLAAGICIEPFKSKTTFAALRNWQHMVAEHRIRLYLVLYDRCKNKCLGESGWAFCWYHILKCVFFQKQNACGFAFWLANIFFLISREILWWYRAQFLPTGFNCALTKGSSKLSHYQKHWMALIIIMEERKQIEKIVTLKKLCGSMAKMHNSVGKYCGKSIM